MIHTWFRLLAVALPGAPEQVVFISSEYDSVSLEVVLPSVGTAPLTSMELEFSSPDHSGAVNVTVPGMELGARVEITLSDLQDGTKYILSLAVYNYGGMGIPSQPITVSTGKYLTFVGKGCQVD